MVKATTTGRVKSTKPTKSNTPKAVEHPVTIYPIRSWSYSRILDYETCALRAQLKYVDKIADVQGEAAERGERIHTLAENFVRGKIKKLPTELLKFSDEFLALRKRFIEKKVSLEGEWGFDKDWNVCGYREAWGRVKLDARVSLTPKHSVVIDYKTGKRFGNEIKHGEQVVTYGIAELLRQPEVEIVDVELWYLDIDVLIPMRFTREQLMRFFPGFEKRAIRLTTATQFPANPSIHNCKWCAYGPGKGGQCKVGVLSDGSANLADYRKRFN
jgi:CRISPR/Cas system-associated exonuclease Cas4 (RecB family)